MKKKIAYILLSIALLTGAFLLGKYTEWRNIQANYIPITDFQRVYINDNDYPSFELKDYGNMNDDINARSYNGVIKQINNQ